MTTDDLKFLDRKLIEPLINRLQLLEGRIMDQEERIRRLEASGNDPLPANAPAECKNATCTYYTHYQVYYDPAKQGNKLTHIAYHHAEKKCEQAQTRLSDWMDKHEGDECRQPIPAHLNQQALYWETKVCA